MVEPERRNIEDYALIGDCETAGSSVATGRSIGCAGLGSTRRLLRGPPRWSRAWTLAHRARRHVAPNYPPLLDGSLILVTTFETGSGIVELVDFMPPYDDSADLVRLVRGVRGNVDLHTEFVLRFDYGSIVPWVERLDGEGLRRSPGPKWLCFGHRCH